MKNKRASKMRRKLPTLALVVALILSLIPLLSFFSQPTVSATPDPTALSYVDSHYVRSTNPVSTTSTTLVDDTEAILNFTTTKPLTAFVMYCCGCWSDSAEDGRGKKAAISIDGSDEAIGYQSPYSSNDKNSITVVAVKELAAGDHSVRGRFCSNSTGEAVTIDERQLAVFLFSGANYHFIRSTTLVNTASTTFVDDTEAIQDFDLASDMLALIVYNAGNEYGDTFDYQGAKYALEVDGADVAQQHQSAFGTNDKAGGTVVHMGVLGAGDHTVKGRFAVCRSGGTVSIRERQLAILLFPDDQLYDFVRSTTAVTTFSAALVDDGQAIVNRNLPDTRQVLIIYNPTKYCTTSSSHSELKAGINVDASDVSLTGQSHDMAEGNGATVIDSRELAAGAHTITGRLATNRDAWQERVDERQLAILYFRLPTEPPVVVTYSAADITATKATLHGTLASLGDYSPVSAFFEYRGVGEGSWVETGRITMTAPGDYVSTVSGLAPDTSFEFRAAAGYDGYRTYGATKTFTTTTGLMPPTVVTYPATNITISGADLNGTLSSLGDYPSVNAFFEYREKNDGSWVETGRITMTAPGDYVVTVVGLAPDTTFEFRAAAGYDGYRTYGATKTFTTTLRPIVPPEAPWWVWIGYGAAALAAVALLLWGRKELVK
ncbi:hypothetical protein ES706_02350 [subsurface metagenome]